MSELYSFNPNRFRDLTGEDVRRWKTLYKLVNYNVLFIDRTDTIKIPIKAVIAPQLELPEFDPGFRKTYEECCQQQVSTLIDRQNSLNVPIRLLYSGGIDSSLILVSFIKHLGIQEAERRVQLVMTMDSIEENPWMWDRVIRNSNFEILNGEMFSDDWDTNRILVGGEFNDQLMGSDIYKDMIRWKGESILNTNWTEGLMTEYHLYKGLQQKDAVMWTRLFTEHIRKSKCSVETMADWWWWINFTCKWPSVYFRMLNFIQNPTKINQEYLDNYYCQFYGSRDFQQWTMVDRSSKHMGTLLTYKWLAKKLIADFLGGNEYLQKIKRGSLWTLLSYKSGASAITSNYEFLKTVNPTDWYNSTNSFGVE